MKFMLSHRKYELPLYSVCLFILKIRSCKSFQVIKAQTRNWTIEIFHKFISYFFRVSFIIKLSKKLVYNILQNRFFLWFWIKIVFLHTFLIIAGSLALKWEKYTMRLFCIIKQRNFKIITGYIDMILFHFLLIYLHSSLPLARDQKHFNAEGGKLQSIVSKTVKR